MSTKRFVATSAVVLATIGAVATAVGLGAHQDRLDPSAAGLAVAASASVSVLRDMSLGELVEAWCESSELVIEPDADLAQMLGETLTGIGHDVEVPAARVNGFVQGILAHFGLGLGETETPATYRLTAREDPDVIRHAPVSAADAPALRHVHALRVEVRFELDEDLRDAVGRWARNRGLAAGNDGEELVVAGPASEVAQIAAGVVDLAR